MGGLVVSVQDRLGYFGPFMQAWKAASPETHATLYSEALQYEAQLIDPQTYVADVSRTLGIPSPVPS